MMLNCFPCCNIKVSATNKLFIKKVVKLNYDLLIKMYINTIKLILITYLDRGGKKK